jgi:hypothetical protein
MTTASTTWFQPELEIGWRDHWHKERLSLAGDTFRTISEYHPDTALTKRYIQANGALVSNAILIDCDRSDAALYALDGGGTGLRPNVITETPTNGHAHLWYFLGTSFVRSERGSLPAIRYAEAITEGLRRLDDGDRGYTGLITKNPVHNSWSTTWVHDHLWGFDEIRDRLGEHMPARGWRRTKTYQAERVGLGRNVTLFDQIMHWSHREQRHHFGDSYGLYVALEAQAVEWNREFSTPLPLAEVHAIARSQHKWITTKSRIWRDGKAASDATFTTIQAARGRKSGTARAAQRTAIQGGAELW